MKKTEIKKNDFRPWVLLVVLIILQVVLGRMVLKQQQEVLVQTDFSHAQSDISVLVTEAHEAMRRKDYQAADHFIRKWGESHTDNCAEIRLTAANGFVISEYRRPEPAVEQYVLSEDFTYSYRGRARLEMVRDLGPVQADLFRLKRILILAGILTTALFSYALWQMVLRQREAFALQERTIALDEAVQHLRIEIDERLRNFRVIQTKGLLAYLQSLRVVVGRDVVLHGAKRPSRLPGEQNARSAELQLGPGLHVHDHQIIRILGRDPGSE